MAASMLRHFRRLHRLQKLKTPHTVFCRTLLSKAYTCDDVWEHRLDSPLLKPVRFSDFTLRLMETYQERGRSSTIDFEIFANKVHEMDMSDLDVVEDAMYRFWHSEDAFPRRDAISHAIIRAYIRQDLAERLIGLMKDKKKYGLHPDDHAACILMDHLIEHGKYRDAARVAYEGMLNEDFSHATRYLLSLYSCVKFLKNPEGLEAYTPPPVPEDEEEEWKPVKVIRNLYYDDHFDIKDEQFLLGKTLWYLGHKLDGEIGRSLQLIGLGMYQKFDKGLELLEKWQEDAGIEKIVNEDALERFSTSLADAETRDPDLPQKDMGLRTMDDEIYLVRITQAEKDSYTEKFQSQSTKIKDSQRVSPADIESFVDDYVKSEIPKYEAEDIEKLQSFYRQWEKEREELLDKNMRELLRKKKEEEIARKYKELMEKEELLNVFEMQDKIKRYQQNAPREKRELTAVEVEDYVLAPGERIRGKK